MLPKGFGKGDPTYPAEGFTPIKCTVKRYSPKYYVAS